MNKESQNKFQNASMFVNINDLRKNNKTNLKNSLDNKNNLNQDDQEEIQFDYLKNLLMNPKNYD